MIMAMRISKFNLCFTIYIIVSSYFMQDVWNAWKAIFGKQLLGLFLIFLCGWAASVILYKNIKSGFNFKKIGLICAVCLAGFVFAWRQPYFTEKAHVLEFAVLGWLIMRDFNLKRRKLRKAALLAFVFVVVVGILEEGFQKLLPWRVFDVRDILTDALSGTLGIILFVLT